MSYEKNAGFSSCRFRDLFFLKDILDDIGENSFGIVRVILSVIPKASQSS